MRGFQYLKPWRQTQYQRIWSLTINQTTRKIIPYSIPQPIFALFEMDVNLTETSGQINGALTYKTCIYNRATIVELVKEYIVLLRNIVNNPNLRISEMNIKSNRRLQE